MSIKIEYCPDLALRNIFRAIAEKRAIEESIPRNLEEGVTYDFLKKGQRAYWLEGELPLLETQGNEVLSAPLASILIKEVTHFVKDKEVWTRGKYQVVKMIKEGEVYFNGFSPIRGPRR